MSVKNERCAIFSVAVDALFNDYFDDFTSVYISGGHPTLGQWNPSAAIRLHKSAKSDNATSWSATVHFSDEVNANEISYRYFIGHCASPSTHPMIHVLKWETFLKPRRLKLDGKDLISEEFGRLDGVNAISDGWLFDTRITEIRFFLFERSCIEFSKPDNDFVSSSFKISLKALIKEGENDELTVDRSSIVSAAIINKEADRSYHILPYTELPTKSFTGGQDLLCFRLQTASELEKLSFKFYICDARSVSNLAVANVKLSGQSFDTISADLVDSKKKSVIGKLIAKYLIVRPSSPSVMQFCNLEKTFISHWKRRPPLEIGHRGMGRSFTRDAKERENTLKSLIAACSKGADFVEFDVQLTKDEIPVLFHDFQINLERDGQLKEYGFKDFTLKELRTLNFRHTHDLKRPDKRSSMPLVDRKQEEQDPSCRAFPSLEEILQSTPSYLGYNVEIKYPMFTEDGHFECVGFFELNVYLDRILEIVVKNAKDRRVVFSSFSPEVCVALKLKQNRYPVLFLTQGITQRYPPYANPLTRSSEIAVAFALSEGFLGVCFHSDELLRTPDLIKTARNNSLVSFAWGDDLDEKKNVEFLKKAGLDGAIYDRLDEHVGEKRNVFAK